MRARRKAAFRGLNGRAAVADLPNYLYDETTPRLLAGPKHSAYIKIAEGCDHPCTFASFLNCAGNFVHARFESVIAEAEQLVCRWDPRSSR